MNHASTERRQNNNKSSFWEYDAQQGFQARTSFEAAEKEVLKSPLHHKDTYSNNTIRKYKRRIPPPNAILPSTTIFSRQNVELTLPTRYSQNKPSFDESGRETLPTTTSGTSSLSTSVVSKQQGQKLNQDLNQKRELKRQLEQKRQNQINLQQSFSSNNQHTDIKNIPIDDHLPLKETQRHNQMNKNVNSQNHQVKNLHQELTQHHHLRQIQKEPKLNVPTRQATARIISAAPISPHQPPPPISLIQFNHATLSPMLSPPFSPIASMRQQRAIEMRAKLNGLSMLPIVNVEENNETKVEKKETEQKKSLKTKKVIRKTRKKKSPDMHKDQHRLLENEVKRMETRIAELKLRREIKVLEEELKGKGISSIHSKKEERDSYIPTSKTTPRIPSTITNQQSYEQPKPSIITTTKTMSNNQNLKQQTVSIFQKQQELVPKEKSEPPWISALKNLKKTPGTPPPWIVSSKDKSTQH